MADEEGCSAGEARTLRCSTGRLHERGDVIARGAETRATILCHCHIAATAASRPSLSRDSDGKRKQRDIRRGGLSRPDKKSAHLLRRHCERRDKEMRSSSEPRHVCLAALSWRPLLVAALASSLLVVFGATTAAASPAVTTRTPLTYPGTNPCVVPAEPFVGTGIFHLLVSGNLSGSGMAQSHLEGNLQGLQAVTITGKKYVVVSSESQTLVLDTADAAPFVLTWVWTVNYVRVGEDGTLIGADDFYLHFRIHSTVNANGVPTVDRFTIETFCR